MPTRINSPIISVDVLTASDIVIQEVNEKLKRPKVLSGQTYQLKTPLSDHTWYITINNIILNEGTPYERIQPLEIFINTKDVSSYQWMIFTSRMISAIFRKGGDVKFILDEMSSVFQPNGGYFGRNGYIPSLVAEIGKIIETHFKSIGLIEDEKSNHITEHIEVKKTEFIKKNGSMDSASTCPQCGEKTFINVEGCGYCTNGSCNFSRCG